eukprot:GHVN01005884.1.p1 GENE.GHVN01005884.1~~GHVN01005884.1.p1  ORF type:complete len:912 (+),score=302.44 GHVN01005884.1:57-2792(+)
MKKVKVKKRNSTEQLNDGDEPVPVGGGGETHSQRPVVKKRKKTVDAVLKPKKKSRRALPEYEVENRSDNRGAHTSGSRTGMDFIEALERAQQEEEVHDCGGDEGGISSDFVKSVFKIPVQNVNQSVGQSTMGLNESEFNLRQAAGGDEGDDMTFADVLRALSHPDERSRDETGESVKKGESDVDVEGDGGGDEEGGESDEGGDSGEMKVRRKTLLSRRNLADIRGTVEELQRQPMVAQHASSAAEERADREAHYQFIRKDGHKWSEQLKQIREAEQVQLGGGRIDELDNTCESWASAMEERGPINNFEQDLMSAINDTGGVTQDKVNDVFGLQGNEVDESEGFKKNELSVRQAMLLKATLSREQARNTRIKKIKSKMWRRIHKKDALKEKEKLMSRLEVEDPELATEVRTSLDTKRAEMRMMRKSEARSKWGQMAARFGGSEMRREVSLQAQSEHDERKAIEKIVKRRPNRGGDRGDDDDDDSTEYDDDDVMEGLEEPDDNVDGNDAVSRAKSDMLKALQGSDDPLPETGILALPFMRRHLEQQRESAKKEAAALMEEINNCKGDVTRAKQNRRDDYNRNHLDTDDDDEGDDDAHRSGARDKSGEADDEDDGGGDDEGDVGKRTGKGKVKVKFASLPKSRKSHQTITSFGSLDTGTSSNSGDAHEGDNFNPWIHKSKSSITSTGTTKDVAANYHQMGFDIRESITSLMDVTQLRQQQEVISSAFVTGTQSEDFHAQQVAAIEEQAAAEAHQKLKIKDAGLPGWGTAWVGPNTGKRTSTSQLTPTAQPQPTQTHIPGALQPVASHTGKASKPMVIINPEAVESGDRKFANRYQIPAVPSRYGSSEQYHSTLSHPTGAQWNTHAVHKRQINVRIGAVVPALQHAKRLPGQQLDSLLDAWTSKPNKVKRTAVRL